MRNNSTLLHRLQLWYQDQPDASAQFYKDTLQKWQPISVRAFWLQVVRIALYLERIRKEKGIQGESSRVVIFAPNSPEWIHWELGAWLSGSISAGIHPNTLRDDYAKMISVAKPILIITDVRSHSNFVDRTEEVLTFTEAKEVLHKYVPEDEFGLNYEGQRLLDSLDPSRPCSSIFTSGTTGTPKGVLLGLSQLTFVADSLSQEWNLPFVNGVLFSFLPMAHIAETIHSVAVAITMRYPVWFNSSFDRFLPELQEVRPTMLLAVPRLWQRMKEQIEAKTPKLVNYLTEMKWVGTLLDQAYLNQVRKAIGLDRLRLAVSGAAKLPPVVFDWFLRLGIEIEEIYGMSETTGLISLSHSPREPKMAEGVGTIPHGTEVKISQDGEVWVKGPHVFMGYDNNPEETHAVLMDDGWMKTGDLGEWIKDSSGKPHLHLIGRSREIIKLPNGRMIAPVPIENELKKIPQISNVCVLGDQLPGLVALVSLKEPELLHYKFTPGKVEGALIEDEMLLADLQKTADELYRSHRISERIYRIMVLSRDFEIELGEMTPTQKLNRNQITKNFHSLIEMKLYD